MDRINLYRKRFIPNETILLKDDTILYNSDQLLVTHWSTLKKRQDFTHGTSAYFLDKGFKISKIYNEQKIVYWYCDIIQSQKEESTNSLIITDLLVDILVYEDGTVKIVDLNELSDAFEQNLIEKSTLCKVLHITNSLANEIYAGKFKQYQDIINYYESNNNIS